MFISTKKRLRKEFYGKDTVTYFCGWYPSLNNNWSLAVVTETRVLWCDKLDVKLMLEVPGLAENSGLLALIESGKFRGIRKSLRTFDRAELRSLVNWGTAVDVHTTSDKTRLIAGAGSKDLAEFLARKTIADYEYIEAPPIKHFPNGLWQMYRQRGYVDDRMPETIVEQLPIQDAVVAPIQDAVVEDPQPVATQVGYSEAELAAMTPDDVIFEDVDLGNLGEVPTHNVRALSLKAVLEGIKSWADGSCDTAKIQFQTAYQDDQSIIWNRGAIYTHDLRIVPFRLVGEVRETWLPLLAAPLRRGDPSFKVSDVHSSGPGRHGMTFVEAEGEWDLVTWLTARIPEKIFRAGERAAERDAYMAKAIAEAGPQPDFDRAALESALDALRPLLEEPLNPGATTEGIDKFEAETGIPIPLELRALYELANGGKRLVKHWKFLSVDQCISEWKNWKSIFDDWSLDELTEFGSDSSGRGIYTNPRWIPFANDGGGNNLFVDLVPAAGRTAQIVRGGADYHEGTAIAPSLTALLLDEFERRTKHS